MSEKVKFHGAVSVKYDEDGKAYHRPDATALRASSPAQEPVTTEPVALMARPKKAIEHLTNHQVQCDDDGVMIMVSRQALDEILEYLAIPAPPQQEEIAEYLYTKFCADPSVEWQDAPEKLKDVWRRYAGEIVALPGEEGKSE